MMTDALPPLVQIVGKVGALACTKVETDNKETIAVNIENWINLNLTVFMIFPLKFIRILVNNKYIQTLETQVLCH